MARREVSGDFDYRKEESVDVALAAEPGTETDVEVFDPEKAPGRDMTFDAFDEDTWYFEPAPPPWYRTKRNAGVLVVTACAAIALVVSGVLLVFRTPGEPVDRHREPVRPTVQTTAPARTQAPATTPPPPRQAPPPRVSTSAAPVAPPPPATHRPRTPPTRTGRDPQIGVTRTPVTRSPISVAPQRPGPSQR